jgi:hypothetical protein
MNVATPVPPPGVDPSKASVARMYDYLLGGAYNYDIDRRTADQALTLAPETKALAWQNRSWLRRAVTFLVDEYGIRQFLDLGSGIPTVGNVHEVARRVDPDCRVVYVDRGPGGRRALRGDPER